LTEKQPLKIIKTQQKDLKIFLVFIQLAAAFSGGLE
jgi:hypothetical protein